MTSATSLAKVLLEGEPGGLEELRIHEFVDDEASHDDAQLEELYAEFAAEVDRVQGELATEYGVPSRSGDSDDEIIPFSGVFRFAVWEVGDSQLFVAAAHEDRSVPIILMIGTA
jgi:hypothetical protein